MTTFALGSRTVHRVGFGAMQLPGPGVFGPPRDHDEAVRVLRRAVELGDGWNPFVTSVSGTDLATTRTAGMTGPDDLRAALGYLAEQCDKAGRTTPLAIHVGGISKPGENCSPAEVVDRIGRTVSSAR